MTCNHLFILDLRFETVPVTNTGLKKKKKNKHMNVEQKCKHMLKIQLSAMIIIDTIKPLI